MMRSLPTDKCVPVEQRGDSFVIARDWLSCDVSFPSREELTNVLSSPFRQISGTVEIDNVRAAAQIFVPEDSDEFCYALIDCKDANSDIQKNDFLKNLESYLGKVESQACHSEAILPEQKCYLYSDYIQPDLRSISENRDLFTWPNLKCASRLMIVGVAGSGKTTLLRRWILELAKDCAESNASPVPIYISLRNWDSEQTARTYVRRKLISQDAEWAADNFEPLAARGAFAFALDGLDEVPDGRRTEAIRDWNNFAVSYPACQIILSTRWGVVPGLLKDFTCVEIQPFNNSQIKAVVYHKLFEKRPWRQFWTRLNVEPELLTLAGNPLALTLLLARYIRKEFSPSQFTECVNALTDAVIDEWDSIRGVMRSSSTVLSPARKAATLRLLANHMSSSGHSHFSIEEVEHKLRQVEVPALSLLQLLEESTSILRRESDNRWSFRHSILQEYFSASHWIEFLSSTIRHFVDSTIWPLDRHIARKLRFCSGLSSDVSDAIAMALEGAPPYRIEIAISLAEILTQKVSADVAVINKYALYVEEIVRSLPISLEASTDSYASDSCPSPLWSIFLIWPSEGVNLERLEALKNLFRALHRARDGSANRALVEAFRSANESSVQQVAELFLTEGRLETLVSTTAHQTILEIMVLKESPEILDV